MENIIRSTRRTRVQIRAMVVMAVFAVVGLTGFTLYMQAANAITTPDSCFSFAFTSGTITDYYDREGNNAANPACPRDVDIPSTIGGVSVTRIGQRAFERNDLTAVTIPNSVTRIDDRAFYHNKLEAVTIPDSVTSMDFNVFMYNSIKVAYVGSGLTAVGSGIFSLQANLDPYGGDFDTWYFDLMSKDPTRYQTASAQIFLTNVYTLDPANPNNLTDQIFYEADMGTDVDGDGDMDNVTALGGHAVNRAALTMNYEDSAGQAVQASQTFVGLLGGNYLTDSSAVNGPSVTYLSDLAELSGYYRIGDSVTIDPEAVSGYVTPEVQSFALSTPSTEATYTYLTEEENQPIYKCLEFDDSTGTITDYYDHENNNAANPACSKDVAIPSTIGGIAVSVIGNEAFHNKQLTSVVIPSSVTYIRGSAFRNNQLSSVTIPDSVTQIEEDVFTDNRLTTIDLPNSLTKISTGLLTRNQLVSIDIPDTVTEIGDYPFSDNNLTSAVIPDGVTKIGNWAFDSNRIKSVTIPDSVTSIGFGAFAMQSNEKITANSSFDGVWYVKLYTNNPANPNNLKNSVISEANFYGGVGSNGVNDNVGGFIVNPAAITIDYRNSSGSDVVEPNTFVGQLTNGNYLHDHTVGSGPSVPLPAGNNPTAAEQQAIDDALAAYYRIGDQVELTPLSVAGYVTPEVQTFTLSGATNQGSFLYKKPLRAVDFSAPPGSEANPTPGAVPSAVESMLASSTLTVDDTRQCSAIELARLLPAADFTAPPVGFEDGKTYRTLGGLEFTLSCSQLGADASVSLSLAGTIDDPSTVRVYKKAADGSITDITSQVVLANLSGKTTISYSLTDGGPLDDDETVNGTISDPIYIAVPMTSNDNNGSDEGGSLSGASDGVNDSRLLADTGESYYQIALLAAIGLVGGSGVAYLLRKSLAKTHS